MTVPRNIGRVHADPAMGDLAPTGSSPAAKGPEPVCCRATPQDALPCSKKPASSMTGTASSSARCATTYPRTISRNASVSQRPRPRIACCRQGPEAPAASAPSHPVLRRSSPSKPSRTASHQEQQAIKKQTSRCRHPVLHEQPAPPGLHLPQRCRPKLHVYSIDAPLIPPLPTPSKSQSASPKNATVVLGAWDSLLAGKICGGVSGNRRICSGFWEIPATEQGNFSGEQGAYIEFQGSLSESFSSGRAAPRNKREADATIRIWQFYRRPRIIGARTGVPGSGERR